MALIRVDEAMKPGLKKGLDRPTAADQGQRVERSQKGRGKMDPSKWTNVLIKEAISISGKIQADAILFYMDSTQDLRPFYKLKSDTQLILLTKRRECLEKASQVPLHAVLIPDVRLTRSGYLKIGFLAAISKGLLKSGDVIVCVGGIPERGYMDTIMLIEVSLESELFSGGVDGPSFWR